jgi:hypothetical protein
VAKAKTDWKKKYADKQAKARADRRRWRQKVALISTGAAIGALEKSGRMDDIPQVMGAPRTFTTAVVAYGLAYVAPSGTMKDIAEGVGDGSACILSYQYMKGGEVSGERTGADPWGDEAAGDEFGDEAAGEPAPLIPDADDSALEREIDAAESLLDAADRADRAA